MATAKTTSAVGKQAAPSSQVLDSEVTPKAQRRIFTTAYKLAILGELDRCNRPGEVGGILRREGLYSSSVAKWRRQRQQGELQLKAPIRRGPTAAVENTDAIELDQLRRENARLERQLAKATLIIGIQKKACQILAMDIAEIDDES